LQSSGVDEDLFVRSPDVPTVAAEVQGRGLMLAGQRVEYGPDAVQVQSGQ
jgi:hypothetical protein